MTGECANKLNKMPVQSINTKKILHHEKVKDLGMLLQYR
jgi:hypothetical protein